MNQAAETFARQLAFGQLVETQVAMWLRRARGWSILPVYEKEIDTGKGPRFFGPQTQIIAPDMLVMRGTDVRWIEAKRKTVFTWHRISQQWTTGIDLRHYQDYCRLAAATPWDIWLLFLHTSSQPNPRDLSHCPPLCPTGLFGETLTFLRSHENHRHGNWGPRGMVYWAHTSLRKIATLDEVYRQYGPQDSASTHDAWADDDALLNDAALEHHTRFFLPTDDD
ncbi:MAG: hypothetical protein MI924_24910 [Chloroflexales bacterium]|nr:hypothetical protein [Chloroflexales bacterium]